MVLIKSYWQIKGWTCDVGTTQTQRRRSNYLSHKLVQVNFVNLALNIDSCSAAKLDCKQQLLSGATYYHPRAQANLVSIGNSLENSPYKTTFTIINWTLQVVNHYICCVWDRWMLRVCSKRSEKMVFLNLWVKN